MSTMVGAVAVERIVDGLLISILFFGAYLASAGDLFTRELRVAAWLSLGGFVALTVFLVLAQIWTDRTIALALRMTLLTWLAPTRAEQAGEKLRALISGFRALADRRNFSHLPGPVDRLLGVERPRDVDPGPADEPAHLARRRLRDHGVHRA